MDRTERFYRIDRLLRAKRLVPLPAMLEDLGVSRATFKRDLEYLRDRFDAPIVWDAELRGYRYGERAGNKEGFELPGFWLSAAEVHSLLTLEHLLENMQAGLLAHTLEPVRKRLERLLGDSPKATREVHRRIRIFQSAARPVSPPSFDAIATAVIERKQLHLVYDGRGSNERTERDVSPQRLVYYRDNWYLDGWCHWRKGLRSFAVDCIVQVQLLDGAAKDVPEAELQRVLANGYGIFSGEATHTAKLRFSAERARWVSRERWHPKQKGEFDSDGRYTLEVLYSDARELLMDIQRHVPHVEVLAPAGLRSALRENLRVALSDKP